MDLERVKKIAEEKDLNSAFMAVFKNTAELVKDNHLEEEDIEGYLYIYDLAIRTNEVKYEKTNTAYVEMLTVNVYRFSKYYWRGRHHADLLFKILNEKVNIRQNIIADFYFELGTYYHSISRYQKALECFQKAFEIREDEPSLYYIVLTERFLHPDKTIDIFNEHLVSTRVKLALQGKSGLKIDPVEKSQEFMDVYDEVHEEAMEILEKEGDLRLCLQLWGILTDCYLKRGIFWRSPALMNPNVRFD